MIGVKKICFCLILLLTMHIHLAHAEIIYLKNGKVVRAKIAQITPIFIRLHNKSNDNRKEYLVDEVLRIEQDATQAEEQISKLAIKNIQLGKKNKLKKQLRKAALDKAAEIVADAMQETKISNFEQAPENVKALAIEVANQLVMDALENVTKTKTLKLEQVSTSRQTQKLAEEEIQKASNSIAVEDRSSQNQPIIIKGLPKRSKEAPKIKKASLIPRITENVAQAETTVPDDNKKFIRKVIFDNEHQTIYKLIPIEKK